MTNDVQKNLFEVAAEIALGDDTPANETVLSKVTDRLMNSGPLGIAQYSMRYSNDIVTTPVTMIANALREPEAIVNEEVSVSDIEEGLSNRSTETAEGMEVAAIDGISPAENAFLLTKIVQNSAPTQMSAQDFLNAQKGLNTLGVEANADTINGMASLVNAAKQIEADLSPNDPASGYMYKSPLE